MTQALMLRILRETVVDTSKYRYTVREAHNERGRWLEFIRIPKAATVEGWEIVKKTGWRSL